MSTCKSTHKNTHKNIHKNTQKHAPKGSSHHNKPLCKDFLTCLEQYNKYLLDLLACIYLLTVIVVLPLYNKGTYASIGSDKRTFFTAFLQIFWKVTLPFALLQILLGIRGALKDASGSILNRLWHYLKGLSAPDKWVAGYMAAVLVSYLASDYKDVAAIGNSSWSMGTLMQLSLCGGYFLLSKLWKKRLWMAALVLPVSCLLFLLGYCNRFGIWPIPMAVNQNPQFISLAGNINWYCGYMVTVLFGGLYLVWSEAFAKTWQKRLMWGYLFIGFLALTTNGSSSGILTLLIILYILLALSIESKNKMIAFTNILMCLGLACMFTLGVRILFPDAITYQETTNNVMTYSVLPVLMVLFALTVLLLLKKGFHSKAYPAHCLRILFRLLTGIGTAGVAAFVILLIMNTCLPGSIGPLSGLSVFTFSPEWGSRRGATWTAGILAWWEQSFFKKLVGVGPDCMGTYLYTDASPELLFMVKTVWPNEYLSNAHCEWLTVLVNLGIWGMISFAGIIIASVRSLLLRNDTVTNFSSLTGACGLAVLAYSVHNIVSFQQIQNEPTMFVLLGIGAAYYRESRKSTK